VVFVGVSHTKSQQATNTQFMINHKIDEKIMLMTMVKRGKERVDVEVRH